MKRKFLILLIILVLALYGIHMIRITSHEAIHKQIFNRYGIRTEVEITFIGGKVTPESYEKCNDSCKLQHTLNDITSYSIALLMIFIVVLSVIYIIYKETKRE